MNKLLAATVAALLLSASPLLADAGHTHAIGRPGDAKKVTRTVELTMTDQMRFEPAAVRVKQGETIRFVVHNKGEMKHELVLGTDADLKQHAAMMQKFPEMEHDDPHAITVEPGKTGELVWQFTRAGNLRFVCLVPGHYEAGMVGKLTVQQAQK
jgi:uncharacterized cupredoxin-like copper-binding protein